MKTEVRYLMKKQPKTDAFEIEQLVSLRAELVGRIDARFCDERFGQISALDLFDEDYHIEKVYAPKRSNYKLSDVINHNFGYMQLSAQHMPAVQRHESTVIDLDICNLYDVDNFIIAYDDYRKCYTLTVRTDFAVEGNSIAQYGLGMIEIEQLNLVAAIAVIDTVLYMVCGSPYRYNEEQTYNFTSHKRKMTHEL